MESQDRKRIKNVSKKDEQRKEKFFGIVQRFAAMYSPHSEAPGACDAMRNAKERTMTLLEIKRKFIKTKGNYDAAAAACLL